MTLTPSQIEARWQEKDAERTLDRLAASCVCAVCGGTLATPWEPALGKIVLRCHRDRSHLGYVKSDPVLKGLFSMRRFEERNNRDTSPIDREIQHHLAKKYTKKKGTTMTQEKALTSFRQTGLITQESAIDIIRTTPGWSRAPSDVVKRAALVCQDYRLYPGIHVFLIAFNSGKANESWAVVQGIKATRLQASRRKPFSYVDGPRLASADEAKGHFLDQFNPAMLYAVCRVRGTDGSSAEGWGTWPRSQTPYGTDKGNSAANMAEIRAERRALDRLCPGELPTGLDVVDESYLAAAEAAPTGRVVDPSSGEIVDGVATEIIVPVEPSTSDSQSSTDATSTPAPQASNPPDEPAKQFDAPTKAPAKTSRSAVKSHKPPASSTPNPAGAAEYKPKSQGDFLGAAQHFYGLDLRGVLDTLDITDLSQVRTLQEAWNGIVQTKGGSDERGYSVR